MVIELRLFKPDSGTSWGFRLVGGAEYNQPLVVVKVFPNTIAEDVGLMIGDVLVRINESPTAGLTHVETHDLILKAGCDLTIGVRRGLFSDIAVANDDEDNSEIESILSDINSMDKGEVDNSGVTGSIPKILENLAGQEQIVVSIDSKAVEQRRNKPKKWTTFLVKPKNPKPIPTRKVEERKIIGEPYRVKIIKQPKRDPRDVLTHKKTVNFEPEVSKVEFTKEEQGEEVLDNMVDSIDKSDEETSNDKYEVDVSVTVNEETTVEIAELDEDSDKNSDTIENDSLECEMIRKEISTKKPKSILKPAPLDIHIDPMISESSLSLEEQLAAVQKQLLALSNLPSAIQITLEAVTQQLNKIVSDKNQKLELDNFENNNGVVSDSDNVEDAEENTEENGEGGCVEENVSTSENAEEDITENDAEENTNIEDLEEDDNNNVEDNEGSDEENVDDSSEVTDPYHGLTEEEKEAKIREEQLLAKKQKEDEERRKMDWTQRPIILPGGRKWSDPDDATPKSRSPKMSDEKICKTIEDYSEVIVGKTKGINFLKYQPPPKNLDYLQKSEVYRLIHGMEPPLKGVGARSEKILSERDYYGIKGAP